MENKYYTPTIEEFHVGFEYESSGNDGEGWSSEVIESKEDLIAVLEDTIIYDYRVKYLNKEDIESLRFKFTNNGNSHIEESDWHFDYIYKNDSDDMFKYELQHVNWMASEEEYSVIIIKRNLETIFRGLVKNKSELIKLLKQLLVND